MEAATAFESPDGKSIYYMKGDYSGGLWKMPVSGGEESQVLPSVVGRAFSLVNDGIYFIPEPGDDGKSAIQFLSFATAKVKTVAPIHHGHHRGSLFRRTAGPSCSRRSTKPAAI